MVNCRVLFCASGPPGSGKTYSGARMIVELVRDGRRVGITAVSHKVITNLLREVCRHAVQVGVTLKAIQKCNDGDQCREAAVTQAEDNQAVSNVMRGRSAQVAAGTAWLWARPEMANSVDVLFLDEAGQIFLEKTLAVSQAATSIVLLGDPHRPAHPRGAFIRRALTFQPLDICLTGTQPSVPVRGCSSAKPAAS